jgi:hypothetical protein
MISVLHLRRGGMRARALALSALAFGACNHTDRVGPSSEAPASEVSQASATVVPAGIMFASFGLNPSQLNTVHTGAVRWTDPGTLLTYLAQVKAKGGRVLLILNGGDRYIRNADNTFNLTKWKTMVDRYKSVNFTSYITDGTVVGHYIIDEPQYTSRWGGKIIPQATVEAAAKYSKQLWPTLTTIVGAPPWWLAASPITYTYLDTGWAAYRSNVGDHVRFINEQVAKAKAKGLGLIGALNVLDGGNGSSGFHGNLPSRWAMSATELKTYGSALLAQPYVCGFVMWTYKATYYDRADVKTAMTDLSTKSRNHVRTSCRQ